MTLRRYLCLVAVLWLLPGWCTFAVPAADVQATLDRQQVALGETVTLNVRVPGGARIDAPDLRALAPDFEVLGSSSNRSLSIINGQRQDQTTFGIALRPTRTGELVIPALTIAGARTTPLAISVSPPAVQASANGGKDVYLETQVAPGKAWVGQQLVFTVRLFFAVPLSSGRLEEPSVPAADISRLGDEINYQVDRNGRSYHVIERRYAVIPQHAGQLDIPALRFQGDSVDPADPDGFFSAGSSVSAASRALSVDVQVAPASWGKAAWLPARRLQLTLEGMPADGKLRVGQPLTVRMSLEATGLPFEALPPLSLPPLDGATVYPEQPVTSSRNEGEWIIGRRQRAFSIVPGRAGKLTIPATTLRWFNVQTGQPEQASIPARTLTVLAAAGAPAAAGSAARGAVPPLARAAADAPDRAAESGPTPLWRGLALTGVGILLVAWLLALLWRRKRANRPSAMAAAATDSPAHTMPPDAPLARSPVTSTRALRATFVSASRDGTPALQAQRLLAWARAERPGLALAHLGALAAALASTSQCEAIAVLQRRCYAAAATDAAATASTHAFADGLRWRDDVDGSAQDDVELPPLYPFKLH